MNLGEGVSFYFCCICGLKWQEFICSGFHRLPVWVVSSWIGLSLLHMVSTGFTQRTARLIIWEGWKGWYSWHYWMTVPLSPHGHSSSRNLMIIFTWQQYSKKLRVKAASFLKPYTTSFLLHSIGESKSQEQHRCKG